MENGGIAAPVVQLEPIIHKLAGCQLMVWEERDAVSGRTLRYLSAFHASGHRYDIGMDPEKARQVGRALIKQTPKDERGEPVPTPLRDSLKEYIEQGGKGE